MYLEVINGPAAGKTFQLSKGQACVVGSGQQADLILPADPGVHPTHLFVDARKTPPTVTACGAKATLELNGEERSEGPLEHLTYLRVGSTIIRIFFEGWAPPDVAESPIDRLVEYLNAIPYPLYAVLDENAAAFRMTTLRACPETPLPLFIARAEEAKALGEDVSVPRRKPWLLPLGDGKSVSSEVIRACWGSDGAAFVASTETPWDLRLHFLRFLLARQGQKNDVFPFYSPAWLRFVLSNSNHPRLLAFLAPFERLVTEDHTPADLIEYRSVANRISRTRRSLRAYRPIPQQVELAAMLGESEGAYATLLAGAVRFPAPDATVRTPEWIEQTTRTARGLGLVSPQALLQYALLASVGGGNVARHPAVAAVLSRPEVHPDSALDVFVLAFNQRCAEAL
jgi:hypothetical protein